MRKPSSISQLQLASFKTKEPDMVIDQSVYCCDGYTLPHQLQNPFRLSFTAALICVNGVLSVDVNQRNLTAVRGDIVIVQSGSIIESLWSSPYWDAIAMAFPDTNEDWMFNRQAEELGSWLVHRSIPLLLHQDEDRLQRYLSFYYQASGFYKESVAGLRDEIVRGFLSISVASFLSNPQMSIGGKPSSRAESRNEEAFLRFMDDLQLYASRERSVQFYADRQCISAKHFSKLIRQASGKLPMEHIRQRVIIEAKTLLRTTDMTIREVADALHFPNDSYFCRYFKSDTGLSPSEYRQS